MKQPRTQTQEPTVDALTPTFSFMSLVTKTAELPKSSRSKLTDPLTIAKGKILDAITMQKSYVALLIDGKPLPSGSGSRGKTLWFSKQTDGYWTRIRYGQQSILIDGKPDLFVGTLENLLTFYDAVSAAILNGELDKEIGDLQALKSVALKGK